MLAIILIRCIYCVYFNVDFGISFALIWGMSNNKSGDRAMKITDNDSRPNMPQTEVNIFGGTEEQNHKVWQAMVKLTYVQYPYKARNKYRKAVDALWNDPEDEGAKKTIQNYFDKALLSANVYPHCDFDWEL